MYIYVCMYIYLGEQIDGRVPATPLEVDRRLIRGRRRLLGIAGGGEVGTRLI